MTRVSNKKPAGTRFRSVLAALPRFLFGELWKSEQLPESRATTPSEHTLRPSRLGWLLQRETLSDTPAPHAKTEPSFLSWLLAAEQAPEPATPTDRDQEQSLLGWILTREQLPETQPGTPDAQESKDASR